MGTLNRFFRGLREFIFDLVANESEIRALFQEKDRLASVSALLFSSQYLAGGIRSLL